MNVTLTILVVFESRRFRKNFFDFSNNTFPIETGIINLFHYIWRIWFIHKKHYISSMTMLKYDDIIKKSRDLDYYFGILWKILCSTTLMQSFIAIEFNWFRIYGGGTLSLPPGYLMSKKPRLNWIELNHFISCLQKNACSIPRSYHKVYA